MAEELIPDLANIAAGYVDIDFLETQYLPAYNT
jgi:hypothetical protein